VHALGTSCLLQILFLSNSLPWILDDPRVTASFGMCTSNFGITSCLLPLLAMCDKHEAIFATVVSAFPSIFRQRHFVSDSSSSPILMENRRPRRKDPRCRHRSPFPTLVTVSSYISATSCSSLNYSAHMNVCKGSCVLILD
jgi:hypothetical protein